MSNTLKFAWVITIAFVFLSVQALIAQTPVPTPPIEDTGQVKTFEVRLPVTVMRKDELVSGLTKGDFVVLEDGVPQEITFFSDEKSDPPVFVGVLMDTSPSTAGKL